MAKRRDKARVVYDILSIIAQKKCIKPTPLLRFSNLSFHLFNEYLTELVEKELVSELNGKAKSYVLTDKGFEYLEKYKSVQDFIEEFLL